MTSGFWAALALESRGGPKIFASDPETGAVLMERVKPGTELGKSSLPEAECLTVFIRAVQQLRGAPLTGLTPLKEYFTCEHAILDYLVQTSPEPVFLHGDLHHFNILESEVELWVTIDPKGLYGDPAFEAAAWLRNPIDDLGDEDHMRQLTQARLAVLSETFGWDPWRMVAWCWVDLFLESEGRDYNDPWARLERVLRPLVDKSQPDIQ